MRSVGAMSHSEPAARPRRGLKRHRDDGNAVDGEGHEAVEVVAPGDEVAGAVERVDDPAPAVR